MFSRQWMIIGIAISILTGCGSKPEILGTWKIDDGFYKATYRIQMVNEKISTEVLSYNDGTTSYRKRDESHFLFKDLQKKGERYVEVDGVTGATTTEGENVASIKLVNDSTLEVTQYIMEHPIIEIWNRIKNVNE